jgi:hypothetical protein
MADEVTPGTAAEPTVQTQAQPETQQDYKAEAETWKNRFTGLQGRYQQERDAHLSAQAKITDLEGTLTQLRGDVEAKGLEITSLTGQVTEWKTKHTAADAELGRLKMVAADFPDLLSLEAKGLLPAGAGDELKGKLTTLRETLKTQGQQNTAQQKVGETPAQPVVQTAQRQTLMAAVRAAKTKADYDAAVKAYEAYKE